MQKSLTRRVLATVGADFAAVLAFIVAVIPASAMTVTFVRHGESEGNASGLIDTKVPGPPLTGTSADAAGPDTGWSQSKAVVAVLGEGNDAGDYDGVYASTMQRTQQTATPFAAFLDGDKPLNAVLVSQD